MKTHQYFYKKYGSSRNIVKVQCFLNYASRAFVYIQFVPQKMDVNQADLYLILFECLFNWLWGVIILRLDLVYTQHCGFLNLP